MAGLLLPKVIFFYFHYYQHTDVLKQRRSWNRERHFFLIGTDTGVFNRCTDEDAVFILPYKEVHSEKTIYKFGVVGSRHCADRSCLRGRT